MSICCSRNCEQVFASVGSGTRFLGGRHFHYIGDVHLLAAESHGRDHVVQQLPGLTNERQALFVLVRAWAFANKHQARVRVAVGEHDAVTAGVGEWAAGAVADVAA